MKKTKRPERSLQIEIVKNLRKILPYPEAYLTAFPAGGGGALRGVLLKHMGLIPGFPDLLLIYRGEAYGMELKAEGGRLEPEQIAAHEALGRAGMDVRVVRSLDDAIETLREWKIPLRIREESRAA